MAFKAQNPEFFHTALLYIAEEGLFSEMKPYLTPINVMLASVDICGISENSLTQMQKTFKDILFYKKYPAGVDTRKPFDRFLFLEHTFTPEQRTWLYFFYQIRNLESHEEVELISDIIKQRLARLHFIERM